MAFINEKDLENFIRQLLKTAFKDNSEVNILNHQAIGDIVIVRNGSKPAIFFLELKYYTSQKGRLGIGTGKGTGIQPEILKLKPTYLETNMMWLLCADSHSQDSFWLLSNKQIRNYLAGGSIGKKQNSKKKNILVKKSSKKGSSTGY